MAKSEGPARNRAAIVAAVISAVMAVAKLTVGHFSGSVAVVASGVDSLLDVLASGLNAWAIRHAAEPPDDDHHFGHGKAESLAALAQAGFIAGSAVMVGIEGVTRLAQPEPVTYASLALVTVGVSTVIALALTLWQAYEVKRTGSVALAADRAHYAGDVAAGLAVMAAVGASSALGWHWVDPVTSLLVAAWLGSAAWGLLKSSLSTLMDRTLPTDEIAAIETELRALGGAVRGWHGLRARGDGLRRFVEVHLEVDGEQTLHDANQTYIEAVERLRARFPDVDVSVHLDPADAHDPIPRR
jgi:ferrous-iron efflux pump FieF